MRILALLITILLTIWHGWTGLSMLWQGCWEFLVGLDVLRPIPESELSDTMISIAYQTGLWHGPLVAFGGAARLVSTFCAGAAGGLMAWGVRRRFIGAVLILGVLAHGVMGVSGGLSALLHVSHDDYLFEIVWAQRGVDVHFMYGFRLPLELLGLLASFLVCTVLSITASVAGKTAD